MTAGKEDMEDKEGKALELALSDAVHATLGAQNALREIAKREDVSKADKERAVSEYGDVKFADPVNKKYPVDTEEHCRAAWSYVNMAKNQAQYSAGELAAIKGRIRAAGKKFGIDFAEG